MLAGTLVPPHSCRAVEQHGVGMLSVTGPFAAASQLQWRMGSEAVVGCAGEGEVLVFLFLLGTR